jgi:YD repeat-containing protein
MLVRASAAAGFAVLPLFAAVGLGGFRLALSDPVLSVIAATEQPLSVRSPGGLWAMLIALSWFGLAYWSRRATWWEAALVMVGASAVLVRLGNAWLYGLAIVPPIARQLWLMKTRTVVLVAGASFSAAIAALTLAAAQPPNLPSAAEQAVLAGGGSRTVFADWRWAGVLQRRAGNTHRVLASGGLASESPEFWLDYVRVTQGHERWADRLLQLGVEVIVLDAAEQDRPAADLVRQSSDWRVTYDADGVLVAKRW